jgi:hypothetical protein
MVITILFVLLLRLLRLLRLRRRGTSLGRSRPRLLSLLRLATLFNYWAGLNGRTRRSYGMLRLNRAWRNYGALRLNWRARLLRLFRLTTLFNCGMRHYRRALRLDRSVRHNRGMCLDRGMRLDRGTPRNSGALLNTGVRFNRRTLLLRCLGGGSMRRWFSGHVLGRHYAGSGEHTGLGRGRNGGMSVIGLCAQRRVAARRLFLLVLRRQWRHVMLVGYGQLGRSCLNAHAAGAAVVANPVNGNIIDHRLVVDVGYIRAIHVGYRTVVVHAAALPVAALVPIAAVTMAVIDPAIEADVLSPVAAIPYKYSAGPAPITWSP